MEKSAQQNITYLYKLLSRLLTQLNVPHTRYFLMQEIANWHHIRIDMNTDPPADLTEIQMIDPFQPDNLAIVLIDVLTTYQIKAVVMDSIEQVSGETLIIVPVKNNTAVPLVLMTRKEESDAQWAITFPSSDNVDHLNIQDADATEFIVACSVSENSGEPGIQKQQKINRWRKAGIYCILTVIAIWVVYGVYFALDDMHPLEFIPLLLLQAMGVYCCYHLYRIDKTDQYGAGWIKKMCTQTKGFGCADVLSSPGAKIAGMISMTDIGTVFFTGNLLVCIAGLFTGVYTLLLPCLFGIYLLTLPFTLYSVYYQFKVVKKWCVLCLLVMGILWVTTIYLWWIEAHAILLFPIGIIYWLSAIAITGLIYFLANGSYHTRKIATAFKWQLNSQQADYSVFVHQLSQWPLLPDPIMPGDIVLGDSTKPRLLAIISPTCVHCIERYSILQQWNQWMGTELCIVLRLSVTETTVPLLEDIMQLIEQQGMLSANAYLGNWFARKNSIEAFRKLYPVSVPIDTNNPVLRQIVAWHGKYPIATPAMFYKGHQVPSQYSNMRILQYLIQTDLDQNNADEN